MERAETRLRSRRFCELCPCGVGQIEEALAERRAGRDRGKMVANILDGTEEIGARPQIRHHLPCPDGLQASLHPAQRSMPFHDLRCAWACWRGAQRLKMGKAVDPVRDPVCKLRGAVRR